jgi:hypothetical protein
MSSAEFVEWQAYQQLDGPLSPWREDWRAALIASTVVNVNIDPKKQRRYAADDLLPNWAAQSGVEKDKPHPLEVAAKVKGYFQGLARKAKGIDQ